MSWSGKCYGTQVAQTYKNYEKEKPTEFTEMTLQKYTSRYVHECIYNIAHVCLLYNQSQC